MGKGEFLGEFELYVMLALVHLRQEAYCMTIRQEIERRLAAELGVNQTAVSDDETGAARDTRPAPDRRFLRRLERLHQLSRRDQQALLGTIDAFLTKVS